MEHYKIVYDKHNNSYRVKHRMKLWFFYVWYTVEFYNNLDEAENMYNLLMAKNKIS